MTQKSYQTYLVGGAVRDELLDYPSSDKDWVVVGATPEQMLVQGFTPIGKDFPVFLHPETKEEYALARTEKKSGTGYHGFSFNADPSVTLEEDLSRRDLTINAIARSASGEIFDPFNGKIDIKNRFLRHVSNAFSEDPLRVLRVARFAARYHHLGFRIAPETLKLMQKISHSRELQTLSKERIWKEMASALMEQSPAVFFQTLLKCGALKSLMPDLAALSGVPQPEQHHPEIDCLVHVLMGLSICAKNDYDLATRYAVLVHDLGKGTTPKNEWSRHIAHEERGYHLANKFGRQLSVPNDCLHLGTMTARWHTHSHRALALKPQTVLKLFQQCDAYRRPERFLQFLDACEADAKGRLGFETSEYPQKRYLSDALQLVARVETQPFINVGIKGEAIGQAIHKERLKRLKQHKKSQLAAATPT